MTTQRIARGGCCVEREWKHAERREEEVNTRTVIFAWWKAYGDLHEKAGGDRTQFHVYVTTLKPTSLLATGDCVRLVALSKDREAKRGARLEEYEPYDPHVAGRIAKITTVGGGWMKVLVLNDCEGNAVGAVEILMPYVVEVTT